MFRPFMLAHPLEEARVSLDDYAAEWKWDGIRVQLVHAGGETRLYSRTGDDISAAASPTSPRPSPSPPCSTASCWCAAKRRAAQAASFNALQQRLGRKTVSAKMQGQFPAFVRLYDILFDGDGGFARTALGRAAGSGWKRSCPSSTRTGSTCRS